MKNSLNSLIEGLNTDVSPIKQPENSYRFALNVNKESEDGKLTDRVSEQSNGVCFELDNSEIIKGTQLLDDNSTIYYIYNEVTNKSIISRVANCVREDIVITSCFNWDNKNRIDSEFKLFKGCEKVLYFTDGVNPIFRVNINSLIDYVSDDVYSIYGQVSNALAIQYANSNDLWNCESLKLIRGYEHPEITDIEVFNSGGSIEVGSYQFAIRYLDNDLNPSDWIFITNPIPIVNENLTSNYFEIDGGISGTGVNDSSSGDEALPPTSKSIQLTINNLDQSYSFYQIAVLQSSSNTGNITEVYIKPEISYSTISDTYVFSGKNSNEDIPSSTSEVSTKSDFIETAEHILQIDNRLLLSNTKGKARDWSKFQKKASLIRSKYIVQQKKKSIYDESIKSTTYFFKDKSYMRDEVYAFAIVWIFSDGTESPAFHIPGRPKDWNPITNTAFTNPIDSTLVSGTGNENFKHLPSDLIDSHERWISINTAISTGTDEGIMGYYETLNSVYPTIRDCNNESIWGVDMKGDSLEGTPIRHHKFPDSLTEKIQDLNNIYDLGVEFLDIEPPQEYANEIQGYRIVRDRRDDVNKTVLSKGILDRTRLLDQVDHYYFRSETSLDNNSPFNQISSSIFVMHSPEAFFNRQALSGNHIKVEGTYFDSSTLNTGFSQVQTDIYLLWNDFDQQQSIFNRLITDFSFVDKKLTFDTPSSRVNLNVNNFNSLSGPTFVESVVTFTNELGSNDLLVVSLDDPILNVGDKMLYVSNKAFKDVYSNLFSLRYINTHPNIIDVSETNSRVFGGDTYITKMDWSLQDYDASRTFLSAYIESNINVDLRHDGSGGICDAHFKGPYFQNAASDTNVTSLQETMSTPLFEWIFRHDIFDDSDYVESGVSRNDYVCGDYWNINPDLIKRNTEYTYFPMPSNFDYCSECLNEFPYRIYYSNRSFQEETVDNYEVFLVNNYTDVMGDQGEITNIFINNDRLFLHCNKALWQVQTRPNEIITSEETIFVGAGELFSIPPRKLVTTDYGYGGSNQKWSTINTEHGTLFSDTNLGKVFILNNGLEEISYYGLSNFFEENMRVFFLNDFKELTGLNFNNLDTINNQSVGIHATYDPRYKRYIITKKDFLFTQEAKNLYIGNFETLGDISISSININKGNQGIVYIESESSFYVVSLVSNQISLAKLSFNNKRYFINKSWTYGYDIVGKKWISAYSYIPNLYHNDNNTFYSYVYGINNLYKHNIKGDYQTFYGKKYPYIISYVTSSGSNQDVIFGSINYVSEVEKYDSVNNQFIYRSNSTFNNFYCSTRNQITSNNSIEIKSNNPIDNINTSKIISKASVVDNSISISENIRDIAVNRNQQSLFTNNWSDIDYSSFFNVDGFGNGYIDYVPNINALDINKNVYNRARMKDKYMIVRLIFLPEENLRMSLQLVDGYKKPKNR
jgi:hypothetical protein